VVVRSPSPRELACGCALGAATFVVALRLAGQANTPGLAPLLAALVLGLVAFGAGAALGTYWDHRQPPQRRRRRRRPLGPGAAPPDASVSDPLPDSDRDSRASRV
jgi:4-hydroxybenzoate polyprenyltransferase